MKQENIIKGLLIFGGGLLLFWAMKPKLNNISSESNSVSEKKSADGTESYPEPTIENADIVANAYASALQAGEPTSALNELNKECMKDYGMRCYMSKDGNLIVCDNSGKTILTKQA